MRAPSKSRAPRQYHEHAEQAALFSWALLAALRYPELDLLHAIPNWAGVKGPRDGAMRKREGVKPGVPDVSLPVARGGFHGLYIEMKYGTNGTSPEQKRWISRLQEQGFAVHVCYSMDEARAHIERYLALPKP